MLLLLLMMMMMMMMVMMMTAWSSCLLPDAVYVHRIRYTLEH